MPVFMETNTFKKSAKRTVVIFSVIALISVGFAAFRVVDLLTKSKEINAVMDGNTASRTEASDPQIKPTLVVYEGPNLIKQNDTAKISVEDTALFVYNCPVNNTHSWVGSDEMTPDYIPMSYFDFEGIVNVKIQLVNVEALKDVVIRPLSSGIKPVIDGNTLSFTISEPGQYSIEYNNDIKNTVFLFANPLESEIPDKNDKSVLYLGPGVWDMGTLTLADNQTLYVAGGALVYGNVYANAAKNINVKGRGIIDGSKYDGWLTPGSTAKVPVNFEHITNPSVEGVILMNPNAWTLNCLSCTNGKIENVKIISSRQNGDGITLQSCNDFDIRNSFIRSWDDSVVVKNYEGNSNNITFSNLLLWTDLAQSCEIGYETNKGNRPDAKISNIFFNDITVLHNFHKPAISIHNSDDALVTDIQYNNIVVEDASMGKGDAGANNQLIDLTIMQSGWSTTASRGSIRNVSFKNIKVLEGQATSSRMIGFSKKSSIENVTIEGLEILGKEIKSADDAKLSRNEFVSNVVFK
jgi:hypothetical protein